MIFKLSALKVGKIKKYYYIYKNEDSLAKSSLKMRNLSRKNNIRRISNKVSTPVLLLVNSEMGEKK